ncbi:GNAT family N-acetyltransferase [Micromonospora sp. DR5-3]|uniref:GNAT family N-acetyltransferase n=1 Tax=unclassified Micromonospora TaxID=2617518 RepID=UPI0011D45A59|nr:MULTISPECIES: GNAT family N-acetyltransferase [unclassified Micromonospora]MCW3813006.1 GNAT family N-acetyltransferase [Micromonospora sp. DR5-3]TYC26000.1 GNAT family N-acetyltransferase [Micromonospora sp. MP36]
MGITIAPFDAADPAAIDAAYRIGAAAERADLPDFPPFCRQRFTASVRHPMPGTVRLWALARLDGVPAGYLALDLPQLDNTDNADAELVVHPAYRRRGVGRALHEHGLRLLREHGRKRVIGVTVSALPGGVARPQAGDAFAAATGARPALAEVRRRLDTGRLDQAALDRLAADARAHATGYRVVRWRGDTPEEYAADVAYLDGRLMADAPLGDLEWEPERIDVERLRATERALDARGRRRYHQAAVHEASGQVVAWTLIDLGPSADWHAWQQITIVDPAHRGHRLGLLVKIENLRYALAHEPALRTIDTWNAAENGHMIAINEQLGFRPVDAWTDWQLTI